jgi:hypothetical protein
MERTTMRVATGTKYKRDQACMLDVHGNMGSFL